MKILILFAKVLAGIVFLAAGIVLFWKWRFNCIALLKGCLGPFLILAGIITLAMAKE